MVRKSDRESYDFGRPKWHLLETLKVPSTYRGMRIVYSYDDGFHDDFRSATTGDACHCKNVSEELQIEYYVEYSLQEGKTITPEPAPSKGGYTFSGWSEIPETMPDHDVTITGTFIENTYLPGDANGDGMITITDIGVIVDMILGKTTAGSRKMQQEVDPQ